MPPQPAVAAQHLAGLYARRSFAVAAGFFLVATALGLLLRASSLWSVPGLTYAFFIHAHSHTAFLGWIYNAFFALALRLFVRSEEARGFWRLFLVTQVAMLGMLVAFPFQGYARESILFSTLHMLCSAVFAWKLLRRNCATRAARAYLAVAFVVLFLSAAGPIALGPLAAAGMRDSPWYLFSIYVYLHFQYNGWFPCFLCAVLLQGRTEATDEKENLRALRALPWITAGIVLTLGVSAFWMQPPAWVWWLTGLGGLVQIVGFVQLGRSGWKNAGLFLSRPAVLLMALALGSFALKLLLQACSVLPALSAFVTHRLVAIAFLHLVFLGVVTPLLAALALQHTWVRWSAALRAAAVLYLIGFASTQGALAYVPVAGALGWPHLPRFNEVLFGGSAALFVAVALFAFSTVYSPRPAHEPSQPR